MKFWGRSADWQYQSPITISGGGLTVAFGPVAPADVVWLVETADVSHNGANPTHTAIGVIRAENLQDTIIAINTRQLGPGTPASAGQFINLQRAITVPPGWQMFFAAEVLAVGEQLTGRMLFQRKEA